MTERTRQPRRVRVRVPATSANLGPGFDSLGLALDLWNEAVFSLEGDCLQITCGGESSASIPADENNLVVRAMRFFCEERGLAFPAGLTVTCQNRIPVGSGLGSSAAAVLTGLYGASALLESPLTQSEALNIAAALEGHADNVAAALFGGLVIAAPTPGGWLAQRIEIPEMEVTVVLPDVVLPTQTARAALPKTVSLKDAAYNLSHALLTVEALRAGDLDQLQQAMDDRLHQPYRLPLIPGAPAAVEAARKAGAKAVAISGAGPSLIAFTHGASQAAGSAMAEAFRAHNVQARIFALKTTQLGTLTEWI